MATPAVTDAVRNPDGTTPSDTDLTGHIRLIASSTGNAPGFVQTSSGQSVVGTVAVSFVSGALKAANGTALTLHPNSGSGTDCIVTPSGTVYEYVYKIAGQRQVLQYLTVADVAGPVRVQDILTSAPASLLPGNAIDRGIATAAYDIPLSSAAGTWGVLHKGTTGRSLTVINGVPAYGRAVDHAPRFAIFGTSRAHGQPDVGSGVVQQSPNAWFTHFMWLGQFGTHLINAGRNGNTTSQMLARISTDLLAYYPDVCFLECSSPNDFGGGDDNATQIALAVANLQTMAALMRAADIDVVLTFEPGKPFAPISCNKTVSTMLTWARQNAYDFIDFRPVLADTSSNIYNAAISDDSIHVNYAGSHVQAQYAIDWWHLHRAGRGGGPTFTSYDADVHNLVTKGTFNSGVAGQQPTGWTLTQGTPVNITSSVVAPTDATTDPTVSGKLFKTVATGSSGSQAIRQNIASGFAVGDRLNVRFWMKASGFSGTINYVIGVLYTGAANVHTPMYQWTADYEGWVSCDSISVPAGTTEIKPWILVDATGGGGTAVGTLWVGQFSITDPTQLGYSYATEI